MSDFLNSNRSIRRAQNILKNRNQGLAGKKKKKNQTQERFFNPKEALSEFTIVKFDLGWGTSRGALEFMHVYQSD